MFLFSENVSVAEVSVAQRLYLLVFQAERFSFPVALQRTEP